MAMAASVIPFTFHRFSPLSVLRRLALGTAAVISLSVLAPPARAQPDLTVISLSAPTNLLIGGTYTCIALVRNFGAAPSTLTRVDIHLSADLAIDPEDLWLTSGFVEPLGAAATATKTLTFSLAMPLQPGTYHLGAVVDTDNSVLEADESNNSRFTGPLTIAPGMDVAVVSLSGPMNVFAGMTANPFTNVLASLGPHAAGQFNTRFYLSVNPVITTNDTLLADMALSSLAAGASRTSSVPIIVGFIPEGDYFLGAIADYDNRWAESNELNNVLAPIPIHVSLDLDLELLGVSGPAFASVGGTLKLTTRVRNTSVHTDSPVFNLGFYRSTDLVIHTTDAYLTQIAVPSLSTSETRAVTQTIDVGELPPGTYYYGAIADLDQQVPEIIEANNRSPGAPVVVRVGLDFAMQSVAGPTSVSGGDVFNVTHVIRNQGADDAAAVDVGFYLSVDPVITTGDRRVGTIRFNSLAAGAAATNTAPCTLPPALAGGTYYLGAIADYLSQVPETNEFNNTRVGNAITIAAQPCDLVTTNLPIVPIASAGGSVALTNIVQNLGSNSTPTHFFTSFFLSTDPIIATNDTLLVRASPTSLGPGASGTNFMTLALPNVSAGNYYVGAIVDPENRIPEPFELNNVSSAQPLHVRHGIELASTFLGASPVWTNNDYAPLTNIIGNLGVDWTARQFYVGYYASQDAAITTNDFLVGSYVLGPYWANPLGPGQFVTNTVVFVPANLFPGQYHVGAIVDYTDAIPEPNETNNVTLGPLVEVRAATDLVLAAFGAPAAIVAGRTIVVTNVVQYAGSGQFLSPHVGFYVSSDPDITTNDTLLRSEPLTFLIAGETRSNIISFTFPNTVAAGVHFLRAVADSRNDVAEPDEANNTLPVLPIQVDVQTDLALTSLTSETGAPLGGRFRQSIVITNMGTAPVVSPFEIGFFLSTDSVITTNDLFVGPLPMSGLAAGSQSSQAWALVLSNNVPLGTYHLGAIADWRNVIAETDENNNAIVGPQVQVRLGLDMTALAVSAPDVAVAGSTIEITNTYANVGLDSGVLITVGCFLSTDTTITTNDWSLGRLVLTLRLVGTPVTRFLPFHVPAQTPPGTYHLGLIIDPDSLLLESDESNNAVAGNLVEVLDPNSISLTQIRVTGTNVLASFKTVPGRNYAVERAPLLPATGSWSPVYGAEFVPGTGGELEVSDPEGLAHGQRFYRVRLLP